MRTVSFLLLGLASISGTLAQKSDETTIHVSGTGHVSLKAKARHVFVFFITPKYFNWSESQDEGNRQRTKDGGLLRYRAMQLNQPSLPPWLSYYYSQDYKAGLLYGVPDTAGQTRLEVVATNRDTFETGTLHININTHKDGEGDTFHVRLKIDNLNIEDVFDKRRTDRILELFKTRFWSVSSEDLHLSFADSALNVGGRRPLKPSVKDGVVIQLGSRHNFSESLFGLDRETGPLRRLQSCSYKRAGFAVDWCSFRLVTQHEMNSENRKGAGDSHHGSNVGISWTFPKRSALERESRFPEITAAILCPILIFSMFSLCLGFLLWTDCGSEKDNSNVFIESLFDVFEDCLKGSYQHQEQQQLIVRANNNNNNIDSGTNSNNSNNRDTRPEASCSPSVSQRDLRASSVQRQSDTIRSLARRRGREVTPRHRDTPTMSLDGSIHSRSRTGSPCPSPCGSPSLGQAGQTGRQSYNWDRFDLSLNRPNPPAYNSLPRQPTGQGS